MKKAFFFLSFLVSTFLVFGQNSSTKSKFKFGVSFSNDIGYRLLKHNDSDLTNDFVLEERNETEIPKFCYSAGLTIAYKISERASLSSGILYSNKGYQTEKLSISSGTSDPLIPNEAQFRFNINYIDVPFLYKHQFGEGKWRFQIGGGITTNVFLNEVQQTIKYFDDEVEKDAEETASDYNRINLSPQVSFGVSYDIHERFFLYANPVFRYGILKIIDAPITAYLFTGGLNIGIQFK